MRNADINQYISQQGFLPLFFHSDPQVSLQLVQALYDGGVRCIEYTNRGPEALENFKFLQRHRKQWEHLLLGIGTIRSAKDAIAFTDAGADFLVSPFFTSEIASFVNTHTITWIPGCATTTEVQQAVAAGCSLIKLFPGEILSPAFVKAIRPIFPSTTFLVTGGVTNDKDNLRAWIQAGVHVIGMGSKLIPANSDWDLLSLQRLQEESRLAVDTIQALKK